MFAGSFSTKFLQSLTTAKPSPTMATSYFTDRVISPSVDGTYMEGKRLSVPVIVTWVLAAMLVLHANFPIGDMRATPFAYL